MLCDVADAGHDRCGRGKNEGAGTEDDQYCHGTDDVMGEYIGKNGDGSGSRDDPDSPAIRQSDDFRLPGVGRLDEADHSLDGTVFTNFGGFHLARPELVDGSGKNVIPNSLVDRQGFAGHDGLVNRCLPLRDPAIDGDGFPRFDKQTIPDSDVFGGNDFFRAVVKQMSGRARSKVDEFFDAGYLTAIFSSNLNV